MANLGFVGLGNLGGQVAKRLMDHGHFVTGYNRTQSRADWLVEAGMNRADTPREAAEAGDFVLSMIQDTPALRAITEGPDGIISGLAPGKVYADMSTVSPSASRQVAKKVAESGAQMVDAPVSGSVITLKAGNMSVIVGGEKEAYEKVLPILRDIGPTVSYVGGNGQAVTVKIALNLTLPVQIIAFSEGVLLAEKSGIDREAIVDVMLNSVVASPATKYRLPFIIESPEEVLFNMDMMQKDIQLALELGRELEVPLPTTAIANEMLNVARAQGLTDEDFASLFKALASMAGVKP